MLDALTPAIRQQELGGRHSNLVQGCLEKPQCLFEARLLSERLGKLLGRHWIGILQGQLTPQYDRIWQRTPFEGLDFWRNCWQCWTGELGLFEKIIRPHNLIGD
ncbi:MAG: hypothetical protein CM15mV106_340 [uncultured marine virus]|nr:MAG: hypothetical protein CM15mV106_340 [uncultured marine virus]